MPSIKEHPLPETTVPRIRMAAECGSFTRTAEYLHLTQPMVSKTVGALEQELDIDWEEAARRDRAWLDPDKLTDFYGLGNGLFERVHFLMGFEEAMYDPQGGLTNLKTEKSTPSLGQSFGVVFLCTATYKT